MAALYVLAGLVPGAAPAAPVPSQEVAEAQLRAIDHRCLAPAMDPDGALLAAWTGDDFRLTDADGAWLDRAGFLALRRLRTTQAGTACEDLRVRLVGPVALVHAVHWTTDADGTAKRVRCTDVHRWSGSGWRLLSVQNTPLQAGVAVAQQSGHTPAQAAWNGHDPTGDELDVLTALNQAYVQAFRAADVAWYDAHLASDYVVVAGDGSFHDRGAALVRFGEPTCATQMRSFPVDQVSVRCFGEVALIHAENAYELKDGRRGVCRYTDIWHRQEGRWLCIAAHITVHKAPA